VRLIFLITLVIAGCCCGRTAAGQTADVAARGAAANEQPIRLRITWGGGIARSWHATISASHGKLSAPRPLGLSADAPGACQLVGDTVRVDHLCSTEFGGLDVEWVGPADATLAIDFHAAESPADHVARNVTLTQICDGPVQFPLDTQGNRIDIRHAPGDLLHVDLANESCVVEPGERISMSVEPRYTGLSPSAAAWIDVRLKDYQREDVLWQTRLEVTTDESGIVRVPDLLEVPAPLTAGVYWIEMELCQRRQAGLPEALVPRKVLAARSLQFVVVDVRGGAPVIADDAVWHEVGALNPARLVKPPWHASLVDWANWSGREGLIGNNEYDVRTIDSADRLVLRPGGWIALALPISQVGQLHRVSCQYQARPNTQLGFSLLEPSSAGSEFGPDSGLVVAETIPAPDFSDEAAVAETQHVIHTWPKTKRATLVIVNRSPDAPAVIGDVRIEAGSRLTTVTPAATRAEMPRRGAFSVLERPMFAEIFSATRPLDPESGLEIDDWQSLVQGVERWVELLKANGSTGAILTVAAEGGAIYPSAVLNPSPRLEGGRLLSSGQDPVAKDVLKLVLKIFEREGLWLVPAVELSAPLPSLEALRYGAAGDVIGIDAVDVQGRRRRDEYRDDQPGPALYNPLDPRVHEAVADVVEELMSRYGDCRAMAGLAVVASPSTPIVLAGPTWNCDAVTLGRFAKESTASSEGAAVRAAPIDSDTWVNSAEARRWRCEQVARGLGRLADEVRAVRSDLPLYVLPGDLLQSEYAQAALSPSLRRSTDLAQVMVGLGIDAAMVAPIEGVSWLRPFRWADDVALPWRRAELNVGYSKQAADLYAALGTAGPVALSRSQWVHLAQLEQHAAFDTHGGPLVRIQPMLPTGGAACKPWARALYQSDCRVIADGGWLMPPVINAEQAAWRSAFCKLPATTFSAVSSLEAGDQSIAVRHAVTPEGWFVYAVNAAPWAVDATIVIQAPASAGSGPVVQALSAHDINVARRGDELWLATHIEPFGLVVGFAPEPREPLGWYSQPIGDVAGVLQRRLAQLVDSTQLARQTPPLAVLANASFESPAPAALAAGSAQWEGWAVEPPLGGGSSLQAEGAHEGLQSLRITSRQGIGWLRSKPFDAPQTGRLSLSMWLRAVDAAAPRLRICLEGRHHGQTYYRFAAVDQLVAPDAANQNVGRWQRLVVHFDDLPNESFEELRVGLDLMGPGTVEVDHVEIFDRWLDEHDATAVSQLLASAGLQLTQRNPYACYRILEGYWPQFLARFFGPPATPQVAEQFAPPRSDGGSRIERR